MAIFTFIGSRNSLCDGDICVQKLLGQQRIEIVGDSENAPRQDARGCNRFKDLDRFDFEKSIPGWLVEMIEK